MFSAILHASDYRNVRFSPAVIISRLIISRHTATLLNYRMTVPVRSDFLVYLNFPEVYHVRGITTPHFSGGEGTVTGQGINTTYRRNRRLNSGISCVPVPLRAGGVHGDPELVIFGSQEEKRETDAEKGTNGVRLLRLGDYCCLGKKLHFINSFQQ